MSCGWFVKLCTFISMCVQTLWDGGKCLCGLVVNTGLSIFQAWVRGGRSGGFLKSPLVPLLPQELRVNWSCSMGFLTQAPRPALWKALMSACLAEWYSVAACLASWQELGLSTLIRRMEHSWRGEEERRSEQQGKSKSKVHKIASNCGYQRCMMIYS